jgi:pyruvate formate lyase activating enzyme
MLISGLEKCSFVDYPGHLSAVVFTGGCNWNCFYCHNHEIAHRQKAQPALDVDSVLDWLRARRDLLDCVVVSGGEPTLHNDLPHFVARLHDMGYRVKLDTNGSRPACLRTLIKANLLDYVAMDIKAPLSKYDHFCDAAVEHSAVNESIDLLLLGELDYEFRTTVVPQLTADDIWDISQRIQGARRYVLQQYRPPTGLGEDPRLDAAPHTPAWLSHMADRLNGVVRQVLTRGFERVARESNAA